MALLGALDLVTPPKHNPDEIASLAHRVETEKLSLQSGIQDQISAANGGVCFIHMYKYPHAHVTKLALDKSLTDELDRRLCLVYLGKAHSSSALHEEVIAFLERKNSRFEMIKKMRNIAVQARDVLLEEDISSFGEVMIANNECQRALHTGLIPQEADSVIELAKKHALPCPQTQPSPFHSYHLGRSDQTRLDMGRRVSLQMAVRLSPRNDLVQDHEYI